MTETNVEIVRRGFDAFATMDMDAFVADWHPDLVWDVHGYEDWPGARTEYKGPPEILAEFANFMSSVRALEVNNLEGRGAAADPGAPRLDRRRGAGARPAAAR